MCGQVGVAGSIGNKEREIFKQLLIVNSLRGSHGTGAAAVQFNGKTEIFKDAGDPFNLLTNRRSDKIIEAAGTRVLIGHGRHATVGGHTRYNAHPFDFRNVVGAHNGTLMQYCISKLKGHQYFDTDSEAIFNDIDEGGGTIEAVVDTIGKIEGAWSLVLYAKKSDKLCLVRNKERSLFYCFNKDKTCMFWASEVWMLYGVLARNSVEIFNEKAMVLPEDKLFAWDIPVYNKAFDEPERIDAEGYKWVYEHQQGQSVARPTQENTSGETSKGDTTGGTTKPIGEVHYLARSVADIKRLMSPHKEGHFRPPYKDIDGKILGKEEFEKYVEDAGECIYCNHFSVWGEDWLSLKRSPRGKKQYMCCECINDSTGEPLQIVRGLR